MTSYDSELKAVKLHHETKLRGLKGYRKLFPLVNKYARSFKRDLRTETMYVESSIDIDVHLKKGQTMKDVYPLVDEMIRDPRLEMTKPLPKTTSGTTVSCTFALRNRDKYDCREIRVYIFLNAATCVQVGTGKYQEITRTACGHYEDGIFVEDTDAS